MDFHPYFVSFFVYYTVITESEDQRLDLSIWTDIHTNTHILPVYLDVFCNVSVVYFMECVSNANLRYNWHMHQLMNFDFLECDSM